MWWLGRDTATVSLAVVSASVGVSGAATLAGEGEVGGQDTGFLQMGDDDVGAGAGGGVAGTGTFIASAQPSIFENDDGTLVKVIRGRKKGQGRVDTDVMHRRVSSWGLEKPPKSRHPAWKYFQMVECLNANTKGNIPSHKEIRAKMERLRVDLQDTRQCKFVHAPYTVPQCGCVHVCVASVCTCVCEV